MEHSPHQKIECPCGLFYNYNQFKKHELTKTHRVFMDTGKPRVMKIDTMYPIGNNKRYYPAVKDAVHTYNRKKQIQKLHEKLAKLQVSLPENGEVVIVDP